MDDVLRIAQLNIGSLFEPEWDRRRHEIAAWLRHLDPDVVCFEEVCEAADRENSAAWIVEQTPEMAWQWCWGGAPFAPSMWPDQTLLFGSAILSRWPIDAFTHHLLHIDDATADAFVTSVPWELLHASTAGLDVFACHLAAAPTHGVHRQRQVLAIDDIIRSTRGERDTMAMGRRRTAMPHVLCGDFNAEPESDEIRFLSSLTALDGRTTFHQDAWRMAGEGPGHTQDWRTNPIAAGMNINRKRIDYVFVGDPFMRAGDAGRIVRCELAFHEPLTGVLASDHAGLVCDIVWPDKPARPG
jgi:endonuclease/exonuclease/phosphatase family metal-dependent hydrolase